ncbi:hypothetical protein [Rufibacter aurantiacus]|uniref:hypothetical protein n=1 Tax=Rufibacter aurantiacus TaxID=2817374 RepID=UPI001B3145E1|nr:hypothetical protein [Rufibacter aurantiacus]
MEILLPTSFLTKTLGCSRGLRTFVTFLLDEKSNQKNQEEKKLADAQTVFSSVRVPPGKSLLFHGEIASLPLEQFLPALV